MVDFRLGSEEGRPLSLSTDVVFPGLEEIRCKFSFGNDELEAAATSATIVDVGCLFIGVRDCNIDPKIDE